MVRFSLIGDSRCLEFVSWECYLSLISLSQLELSEWQATAASKFQCFPLWLCMFFYGLGSSVETGAPVLTMEPMWDRFLTGDRIILSCNAGRELRSTTYNWIIKETIKEFREKTYIIEAATKEDDGEYRCQYSTSAHKTPYSNSILVRVSSPDSLMSIESEPEALWYAQTLKLSCKFKFHMQNEFIYTFYREGSVVAEIRTRNKSVCFEKERVTFEDTGRYRCQMQFVNHPKGPVYTSAYKHVDVQDPPGNFALIVGGSAVAAVLLTFLLLFAVCRLCQKEGVQNISNSQPSRDVSGSTSGDIVYSVVQGNRKERGHIRARRESREADSHVTYASLMHLERTREQDVRAGRQEDNGSSTYQNIRRS
ncbi:uncharacterized protein [Chiloscyllium punctatum]|uniref:uncharacterized protein isoform X3 n=1 Tax=Chiloscyllium punctatum TaxID=137246 RepID=UPI003B638855